MDNGLTNKQKRFCEEYIKDFNATAAYIRAGYSVRKRSTASKNAPKLLKKSGIRERISSLQEKVTESCVMQKERVIQELARVAFYDLREIIKYDPVNKVHYVDDISDLPPDTTAAIRRVKASWITVEVEPGRRESRQVFSLELHDKLKALELAGKHLGLFEQDDKGVNVSFNYITDKPKKDVSAGVSDFKDYEEIADQPGDQPSES